MNKILDIKEDIISIGLENGELIEVRKVDLNFEPRVGDVVDVFKNESRTTVVLADGKGNANKSQSVQDGSGLNIHINNDHSNSGSANNPTYIASGKVVNKVVYSLLAIFLGGLGAHKFYSGKMGVGFVYLILCWSFIPSLIGVVEGLIALTKPADANGNIII